MIGLSYGNFQAVTSEPFSFGNALQFDRVNDFINRTSFADELNGTCTFGFWFKRLGICNPYLRNTSESASYIGPKADRNGYRFRWRNSAAELNFTYTPTFETRTWYSLIVSKTTTNLKIFINGSEEVNKAYTMTDFATGQELRLNSSFGTGGFVIDQLFIVPNIQITSTEATALYNGGNGDFVETAIGTPSTLINFNQNSPDTTATDESGNGYDFTLNNFDIDTCWVAH